MTLQYLESVLTDFPPQTIIGITNQMLFVIDFMLNHANVNKFFDKCRISYSCDKLMFFLQNNRKTNIVELS